MEEYPIKKFDSLGREYFIAHSPGFKVSKSYWGTSKKIKIRYRIYNKDIQVAVYDLNGNTIITNERGPLEINLENFKILPKKGLFFRVTPGFISEWSEKIKKAKYGSKNY